MKKIVLSILLSSSALVYAQDRRIGFNELPKNGQAFVSNYYGQKNISYVELDKDILDKDYKVYLNNGTKIEFDGKGNWKEVESRGGAVPSKIVPNFIKTYVKQNYKGAHIVKIERDNRKYEVELSNGIELDFNKNGKLLKVDR